MRTTLALLTGLFALGISQSAFAGDVIAIGVGLQGHLGAAASTGLGPQDVLMPPSGFGADTLAKAGPSFGGPYGGIGAMAELRLIKMLGIEVDYTRTLITASGDVPLGAAFPNPTGGMGLPSVNLAFNQWQHQIAILGKFALPSPLVAPFIAVGPEFAFPDSPDITIKPSVPGITITAHAGGYTMLTGVIGVELKLPIPKIDIRIPVGARLSYNLSSPDNPAVCGDINGMQLDPKIPTGGNCRLHFTGTLNASTQSLTIDYRTEWKYMIGGQAGIAVYF
jgi:hypothetical protein